MAKQTRRGRSNPARLVCVMGTASGCSRREIGWHGVECMHLPALNTKALPLLLSICSIAAGAERITEKFDYDWRFIKADPPAAQSVGFR